MKKIISITLCLLITFSLLSVNTFNAFAIKSGITGGCTWTLDGTELTISGTGAMGDYIQDTLPWGTGITKVTIENGVTTIGVFAFRGCKSLASIEIPDSVTSIGAGAFEDCTRLASIEIPDGVTAIYSAFGRCTSLASVSIGNSVTTIGVNAFYGCTSLASIVIPDSVTSIGYRAFYGCTSLASIVIPDGVTTIVGAFDGCTSLASITISDSVTTIRCDAFNNTAYYNTSSNWKNDVLYIGNYLIQAKNTLPRDYTIKDGIKCIAVNAFSGCTSLASIVIPDSVTTIGGGAFSGCKRLTSIEIPDSVTSIGNYAFNNCTGLKDIYYLGTAEQWEKLSNKPQGTVHFCKPGDTNGDGGIDDKDISALKRYLAGWNITVVESLLDINGDGTVDDKDANYLARSLAGWSGYEL